MKRKTIVVCACFLLAVFCAVAVASEYKLTISMEPQQNRTWCAISVVQAWVGLKRGICITQDKIANTNSTLWLKSTTGIGWSAGDVETALEFWTGDYSFTYYNYNSVSSAFDRLKKELKDEKRPVAIAGNACYPNGVPKGAQGHWLLIEGLNLKNNNRDFDGVYIKDPLYGSTFASNYETIRPRTWVRDLFTKWWIPNKAVSSEFRQLVED